MHAHWLDKGPDALVDGADLTAAGIIYETMTTAPDDYQASLDALKDARGYVEQDEIAFHPDTPNLSAICDKFSGEHFHTDDEVRFVLKGAGIFDIRSAGDEWMRVTVTAGDLIVVPKDCHHRFFLTDEKMIRCVRLFKDTSGWTAHYRAA